MDGWLGFNGILSTQVAAISCLNFACTDFIRKRVFHYNGHFISFCQEKFFFGTYKLDLITGNCGFVSVKFVL